MKLFSLLAALILISHPALAQNSLHDEALVILEGQDRVNKKPCQLYVLEINGHPGEPGSSMKVATSYSHNSDTAGHLLVDELGAGFLSGKRGTRDQITIFYEGGVFDFNRVTRFNLRWWHVNHAHNYSCINLKVHDHDHD